MSTASSEDDFWAITSYFNPARYRRKLSNFKTFRKHLTVPLVAVELAYSDAFELQEQDADILVQLRGGAVLWQKERLLNVALKALPKSCRKVAWLDCDLMFRTGDWAEAAAKLLDRAEIVQLFKHAYYLPPQWNEDCLEMAFEHDRPSATYALSIGMSPKTAAPGHAWAARRELLDRHGFYDACILGGGDCATACWARGCMDWFMDAVCMNERARQRYLSWAEPFHGAIKGQTACIDSEIVHLWHGHKPDRAYFARHEGMQRFEFDPFEDIVIQQNGCWGWNSDKPELHAFVRNYFFSRREDG